MSIFLHIYHYT